MNEWWRRLKQPFLPALGLAPAHTNRHVRRLARPYGRSGSEVVLSGQVVLRQGEAGNGLQYPSDLLGRQKGEELRNGMKWVGTG